MRWKWRSDRGDSGGICGCGSCDGSGGGGRSSSGGGCGGGGGILFNH